MELKRYVEKSNEWLWGKIFLLKSEQFGIHLFLVSKYPARGYADRNKFVDLVQTENSTIFYSSVASDEIIEVWESMEYYAQALSKYEEMKK